MDNTKLKKEIGFITLASLGIGGMIGSGVFGLPAVMSASAGPAMIISIIIAGIATAFLALAYAELGAAFPVTGGPYVFPRLAMGNLTGFVLGWGYFLFTFIGTAAIINIFVVYLGYSIPGLAVGQTLTPAGIGISIAILFILTIINIIGVKWGGLYSVVTTFGKLIPLILFVLLGLALFNRANFQPFAPFGLAGVTIGVSLFFWAYTGFDVVVVPSEEVRNPARTIPLAMITAVAVVCVVYILIAVAFVGVVNWGGLNISAGDWGAVGKLSSPLSHVSAGAGLAWLATIVTLGAMVSTAGTSGVFVLTQGRLPYAMSKDNLFWSKMDYVHPRFGTPVLSIIFASFLTMVVQIAIPNFPSVALIASITAVVPYAAAGVALLVLRKTRPEVPRPFKLPFAGLMTLAAFILSTLLIYWACWPWTLVGAVLMFLAYPLALFVKARPFEFKRGAWIPVYLIGVVFVSLIGDPAFEFNNFTPWKPLGLLKLPYDIAVLAIFSVIIFAWAYYSNTAQPKISETCIN